MAEGILKIMTISLMGNQKSKAYAVFNGEQLVITRVDMIAGPFGIWRKPIVDEIIDKKSKGYVVLVEEKTDLIAHHATQYLLEDIEGKSNLYDALDWYFALQDIGNLITDDDAKRFLIRAGGEGQKVEKKQDEKGQPFYSIDWSSFSGGHRAVLLCVVAAMTEPLSDRFIKAMFGEEILEVKEENPARRWQKLIHEKDIAKEKKLESEKDELAKRTING